MSLLYYPLFFLISGILICDIISLANPDWTAKFGVIRQNWRSRTLGYNFGLIEWCESVSGDRQVCHSYKSTAGQEPQEENDRQSDAAFGLNVRDAIWWREACLAMMILSIIFSVGSFATFIWQIVAKARGRLPVILSAVFLLLTIICRLVALGLWGDNWAKFAPTLNLLKASAVHVVGGYFQVMFILTAITCLLAIIAIAFLLVLVVDVDFLSRNKGKHVHSHREINTLEVN